MFGFLNVYKPKGKTSHDVVAILRRVTKIKQIGHTGTLDPFAEGVLPICIGNATRLIEYLEDDKAYVGTIQLGNSTTTYDIEGEVVNSSDKRVSLEDINNALSDFRGEIEQLPPIYSAIKVDGKKLYEYARKGEEVKIQSRRVNIYKLEVRNFDYESRTVELYIECSKGTYIRSIANDVGEKLGTYGHLIKLERVKAGRFLVENSIKLEDLNTLEIVKKNLINPVEYLNYPKIEITEAEYNRVKNGNPIKSTVNGTTILLYNSFVAAVAEGDGNILKCKKCFCS